MVRAPFQSDDHVVVVVPERGGAGQDSDVRKGSELRGGAGDEIHRVGAVDGGGGRSQAAAESGRIVGDDDPRARARRGERRHQPAGSGAHHQHVAEGVAAIVVVGVGLVRSAPEPRRLADEVLVELPPRARPHERLVVEPGREELRGDVAQRAHVEVERGPVVLAAGDEPVEELDLRRLQVGFGAGALAHTDQGVGLFRAGADDASAAVVLEAASDDPHAVREQGGSERIAPVAREAHAVESEFERCGAVDAPSPLRSMGLPIHRCASSPGSVPARTGRFGTGLGGRVIGRIIGQIIGVRPRRDRHRAVRSRARGGSTYRA